jgi:hypothetical protein
VVLVGERKPETSSGVSEGKGSAGNGTEKEEKEKDLPCCCLLSPVGVLISEAGVVAAVTSSSKEEQLMPAALFSSLFGCLERRLILAGVNARLTGLQDCSRR